jgi:hypothetical protein
MDLCPHCGTGDQVQRASAIVSTGTVNATSTGSALGLAIAPGALIPIAMGTTTRLTGQTPLAHALTPPPIPFPQRTPAGGWILIAISVLTLISATATAITHPSVAVYVYLFTVPVAFGGLGSMLVVRGNKAMAAYEAELPVHQMVGHLWGWLDYCHRCDVVFLSGSPIYAYAHYAWNLLYDTARSIVDQKR